MVDREKVIKGLSECITVLRAHVPERYIGYSAAACFDAIELLKDSGQDEGWLCEKRTSGRQPTDLLCACGNKVYFTTLLFKDGFTANELCCPNCGLSMRSPHHDKNGVWLRKNWEEVVLKAQDPVKPKEVNMYPPGQYACGSCGHISVGSKDYHAKYCPECGRGVKWNG